jgi:hypothetical protein
MAGRGSVTVRRGRHPKPALDNPFTERVCLVAASPDVTPQARPDRESNRHRTTHTRFALNGPVCAAARESLGFANAQFVGMQAGQAHQTDTLLDSPFHIGRASKQIDHKPPPHYFNPTK